MLYLHPSKLDNSGQLGGLSYFVGSLIILGLILIAIGPIVDKTGQQPNEDLQKGIPRSQASLNTIGTLINIFKSLGIIFALGFVGYLGLNALKSTSGPAY